jgi:8-oxo-dGTP pyrophosphatase MutT (NUDIX family)
MRAGGMEFNSGEEAPAHPSATVVIVRPARQAAQSSLEVLLVQRSQQLKHMAGMWVFPGGRVEPQDERDAASDYEAALAAAIRETREETALDVPAQNLFQLSHWTTPVGVKKRYATWFFVALVDDDQEVVVDGGEIARYRWMCPALALEAQRKGELVLLPPTYITLLELARHGDCNALLADGCSGEPTRFEPRVTQLDDALHFLYDGDAGYEASDPAVEGRRHRCIMVGNQLDYLCDIRD